MSLNSDLGCELQFCHISPGEAIMAAIFLPLFVPWLVYMMLYRTRDRKFQSIRVVLLLGSVARLMQIPKNQTSLAWSASIIFVTFGTGAFQWQKNSISVAYATVAMGMPPPRWLGAFTRVGQAFLVVTYPLLVLVFRAKGPMSCDLPSFLYDVVVIMFIYGIGVPILASNLQLRRVMRTQEKTMREQEARERNVKSSQSGNATIHGQPGMSEMYRKARVKLNKLSALVIVAMLILTLSFVLQLGEKDPIFLCSEGSLVGIAVVMNILSLALAWHTNVQPLDPKQKTAPDWLARSKVYKRHFAFTEARKEQRAPSRKGDAPQKVHVVPRGVPLNPSPQTQSSASGTDAERPRSPIVFTPGAPIRRSDGSLSPIHESRTYIEPMEPDDKVSV